MKQMKISKNTTDSSDNWRIIWKYANEGIGIEEISIFHESVNPNEFDYGYECGTYSYCLMFIVFELYSENNEWFCTDEIHIHTQENSKCMTIEEVKEELMEKFPEELI